MFFFQYLQCTKKERKAGGRGRGGGGGKKEEEEKEKKNLCVRSMKNTSTTSIKENRLQKNGKDTCNNTPNTINSPKNKQQETESLECSATHV